jgi:NADPH-dependent 2,4-dienoyl-CoA reductase/sulfur reductase-like enzyme
MNRTHVRYLIVGAGLAGSSAAEAIRRRDPSGSVLLIGQEVNRPYHRPPLSGAFLARKQSRSEMTTLPLGWYADWKVELRTGVRATRLDMDVRAVVLDSGDEVHFDQLLLCTGLQARPVEAPGADLPNVFPLRSILDADRIHHAIDKARTEGMRTTRGRGRALVIGGSLLGVEVAQVLAGIGLEVELVVGRGQPWSRFVSEETGRIVAQHLQSLGILVRPGQRVIRLEGDGRVQRAVLQDEQRLPCDFAVTCTGARFNRELLRGTQLVGETAILVDEQCRTNVTGVFAAGDCCAVFDPIFEKHRQLPNWDAARLTGGIAGANMAGASERYNAVSRFATHAGNLELTCLGDERQVDRRLVRGIQQSENPKYMEIGIDRGGKVAHVAAIGTGHDERLLAALIRQRLDTAGREEALRDDSTPLEQLLQGENC